MIDVRIHKYIADCGIMSRRAAEEAVKRGEIKVNGEVAELGMKIDTESDVIEYKGKTVKPLKRRNEYIILNKPVGYVTTLSDEKGRPCIKDLISDIDVRVYPVGRLDYDSEGLLLLTNDGELTARLTHPRHGIAKYYNVTVKGQVTMQQRKLLSSEMVIDGYKIMPVKNEIVSMREDKTVLGMELYEGRNRQIRKMCEKAGLEVTKLRRIAIGQIELGNLKPGCWKRLTGAQIEYLKTACKMK
ncbi:MAG: rRNA pseudouridine synthase [Clostridia bacterium]|nr:rRNA pseudouridine synthase [Clostridia bacterium]